MAVVVNLMTHIWGVFYALWYRPVRCAGSGMIRASDDSCVDCLRYDCSVMGSGYFLSRTTSPPVSFLLHVSVQDGDGQRHHISSRSKHRTCTISARFATIQQASLLFYSLKRSHVYRGSHIDISSCRQQHETTLPAKAKEKCTA